MNRRGLAVAAILLLALAAYAWYALRQEERGRREQRQPSEHVLTVPLSRLHRLEISVGGGPGAVFVRGEEGWRREEGPEGCRPELVPDFLYSWSSLRFARSVEERPQDLARYGLDPPVLGVAATGEAGLRRELALGRSSEIITAPGLYARLDGEPTVVLLEISGWTMVEEAERLLGLRPLDLEEPVDPPPDAAGG